MKNYVFADIWRRNEKIQIGFSRASHENWPSSGDLVSVSGQVFVTRTGEKSLLVESWKVVAKWQSDTNYQAVLRNQGDKALEVFVPGSYDRLLVANLGRKYIRQVLEQFDYFEVQTPIVLSRYNGGRSLPIAANYLGENIGFLRITMEERLKAIIASGFDKVFQIGSVFRGSYEFTLLEAFSSYTSWDEGETVVREVLAYTAKELCQVMEPMDKAGLVISQNDWEVVDFFEGATNLLKEDMSDLIERGEFLNILVERGLSHKPSASVEAFAEDIAAAIAVSITKPCIIRGFPAFASPLYSEWTQGTGSSRIQRSKGFVNGRSIFDLGNEENKADRIAVNIADQRRRWNLKENDPRNGISDLLRFAYCGLPPMTGFAISIDRLVSLFHLSATTDLI